MDLSVVVRVPVTLAPAVGVPSTGFLALVMARVLEVCVWVARWVGGWVVGYVCVCVCVCVGG